MCRHYVSVVWNNEFKVIYTLTYNQQDDPFKCPPCEFGGTLQNNGMFLLYSLAHGKHHPKNLISNIIYMTIHCRHYKLAVVLIWMIALTINLPWLFVFTLEPLEGSMAKVCIELWPSQQSGNWYFVFANLIVCYLLPLLIISLCYIIIWRKVSNRGLPHEIIVNRKHDVYMKSKVKVSKLVGWKNFFY